MTHRIAFASADGKYIDTHFGHAERFLIVDVSDSGYSVADTRQTEAVCRGFDHSENDFYRISGLLNDCEAVFVSRIGRAAAQYMFVKGIRVFEAPYFIEDVLKEIINKQLLDKGEERNGNASR